MNRLNALHPETLPNNNWQRWPKDAIFILDDFGLQNMSQEVRLTLLQLLEDRYGKKSIIVTSQLPVAKWYEYIFPLLVFPIRSAAVGVERGI